MIWPSFVDSVNAKVIVRDTEPAIAMQEEGAPCPAVGAAVSTMACVSHWAHLGHNRPLDQEEGDDDVQEEKQATTKKTWLLIWYK